MLQVAAIVWQSFSPFRGLARRFGQQPVRPVIHPRYWSARCGLPLGVSMGVLWRFIAHSVLRRIAHH